MPRKQRDVEANLEAKGFVKTEGDHHFYVYHTLDGKKTRARTKTSHGGKEIGDPLLTQMAKQCHVPKGQFLALVDCTLNQEGYEELLSQRGLI